MVLPAFAVEIRGVVRKLGSSLVFLLLTVLSSERVLLHRTL